MSKTQLKKMLGQMSKDEIIVLVGEIYTYAKGSKDFIDNFMNPENAGKDSLQKYKKIIIKEFTAKNSSNETLSFATAKRAIKDFKDTHPNPVLLAELMMDLPELAAKYTYDYGDMWEQFYTSTENNFDAALKFIAAQGLLIEFQNRAEKCVKYASKCGWGFAANMEYVYELYYLKPPNT